MRILRRVGLGVVGLVAVLLVWGVGIEPRLIDTEEYVVEMRRLPPAWEGERIAAIADLQVGMWWANTGTVERIVDRLVEARPAAVLILGDFVYDAPPDPTEELRRVVELLRPLPEAGIPTFAVLGNHDYALFREDAPANVRLAALVGETLEAIGVRVLHNQAARLERDGAPLYLVGIGSNWAEEDHPEVALRGVPAGAARVVFMHNPRSFRKIPPGEASLAVAGHTHGGQLQIPYTGSWSWLHIVKEGEFPADGWIEGYGAPGNRLYVNRGIGFSRLPIRINSVPELTWLVLSRATSPP